jgi:RimJ/RimL family protein N-acetyltransferase
VTQRPVPRRQTDRLVLRGLAAGDRRPFAALNADPRVMEHFPAPLTREQSDAFVDRIERTWERRGFGLWALERRDNGDLVGCLGLWPVPDDIVIDDRPTPCVEVGWRLAYEAWGLGFATEAGREALRFAADIGLVEVVSFTAVGNRRSRAVMERLGMVRDVRSDFGHPALPAGHRLRAHVLYRRRLASP